MDADEFLAVYDVSDTVGTVVEAPADVAWEALVHVDLIDVGRQKRLVALLGAVRGLPDVANHLLRGRGPPKLPSTLTLEGTAELPTGEGGWVLLAKRPSDGIALGLVGTFWRPVIRYAFVTPETFAAFDEPGYAKTVYVLTVRALAPARTFVTATMRTATTDAQARRWFRRYWTLGVGSGAHVLANAVLDVVREDAERRTQPS